MSMLRILSLALLVSTLVMPAAWGKVIFLEPKVAAPREQGIVIRPPKPGAPKAPAVPTVQLSTGPYTPAAGVDPRLSRELATKGSAGQACLLLCRAPVQAAISEELTRLGVQVLGVYPDYTYIVRVQARHLEALMQRSWAHWVGMLPAANKLAADLGPAVEGEDTYRWRERVCAVNVYDAVDADLVRNRLGNAGIEVESWLPLTRTFVCRVQAREQAAVAAAWGEVSFVEPAPVAHPDLLESVALCGHADYVRANTTYGWAADLAMIDTGLAPSHTMLSEVSPYPTLYSLGWNASGDGGSYLEDPSGHGTHMAGIILGRGTSIAGMCPGVGGELDYPFRVVRCSTVSDPTTLVNVEAAMSILADNGGSVYGHLGVNCSWSNGGNTGLDLTSRMVDAVVWTARQTYVCSAGNGGPNPATIAGPAAAKNAIAVGSVSKDSTLTISSFSGRGPTADGREKPDVYAPGEGIISADASGYSLYKAITGLQCGDRARHRRAGDLRRVARPCRREGEPDRHRHP